MYKLNREGLEKLIVQRLLTQEAAQRQMSVAALIDAEVTAKAPLVTEAEIDAFYEANKARLRGDTATIRRNVQAHLRQQNIAAQRVRFVESLRSKANVLVRLSPPPVPRFAVSTEGAPQRGPSDAPVTLVEFSDFHCPFCKQTQRTLTLLFERFPDKLRLVYRNFPLDSAHPEARRAAEAARCAHDQGKFWEYHDLLFTNAPKAGPQELRRYAERVGLDVARFDKCVGDRVHRVTVQRDVDDGFRLGIAATPTFFINGRPLSGAQPMDAFIRVIEEEMKGTVRS
jgi:protein-disulfide isomerase